MGHKGGGVPVKAAMDGPATGQSPIRLNGPLAPFCYARKIFMNPEEAPSTEGVNQGVPDRCMGDAFERSARFPGRSGDEEIPGSSLANPRHCERQL